VSETDEQAAPRLADPYLDRKLFEARTVTIFGEINQELSERVIARLLALSTANDAPIKVVICSQGGHVEAGDAIHDFMRFIRPRVIALGTGWVASAGAHIFLGATARNRFCLPNTRFMLHQPLGSLRGRPIEFEIEAREIVRMRERINRIIARETGQPYEKVQADTDRNFWMGAEEATKYGLVHQVVETDDDIARILAEPVTSPRVAPG
jgi:ATP-dependent Clp protease, protease subunit